VGTACFTIYGGHALDAVTSDICADVQMVVVGWIMIGDRVAVVIGSRTGGMGACTDDAGHILEVPLQRGTYLYWSQLRICKQRLHWR
jgi:hypothetical protein